MRTKAASASSGYVIFSPLCDDTTYLIDRDGQVVHTWKSEYAPTGSLYLLDNGHLVRGAREPEVPVFSSGGQGGRIQEFTWDGDLVWDYLFASETHLLHHDFEMLPNGNILAIAWERKTVEDAHRAGRKPERTPKGGLWPDKIVELEPLPPNDARIVWEWHMWDHTIQNHDASLGNYGEPSEHPERVDINGGRPLPEMTQEELEKAKAAGNMPSNARMEDLGADMLHSNAIHYDAELDQIVISVPTFNEIWIIDHGTTTRKRRDTRAGVGDAAAISCIAGAIHAPMGAAKKRTSGCSVNTMRAGCRRACRARAILRCSATTPGDPTDPIPGWSRY